MVAPSRRAFFYPRPVLGQPGLNERGIPLQGAGFRLLDGPAEAMEQTAHIIRVVVHLKGALDQLLYAGLGPAFGRKAGGAGPAFQKAHQLFFLSGGEFAGAAGRFPEGQSARPFLLQHFFPLTDRRVADAQVLRNLVGSQFPRPEQFGGSRPPFSFLLGSKMFRLPCHVPILRHFCLAQ